MWRQNWRQYVWTSLCQFIFLWTSSIVHVFDFLTFDIFLTTWHLFDTILTYKGNRTHGQRGITVNIEDRDGVPWEMGHIGDGAHGQWGTWAHDHNFLNTAWIFTKILLHIDIDVFYLNIQSYFYNGLSLSTKIDGFEILIGSYISSMNLFQWVHMQLHPYLCYQLTLS